VLRSAAADSIEILKRETKKNIVMKTEEAFLQAAIKKFNVQKTLGEKTFAQLDEKDLFFKPSKESNSIAVIVQHMNGNMLSRWTNFLTEDGEKPWRERDKEFEDVLTTKDEVVLAWNAGWRRVLNTLELLQPEDMMKTVTIRNEPLSVVDAIIRQIDHYGYHAGQIVYVGRMIKDEGWQSLSIPKNKSKEFNDAMKQKG
jgi:hypothetical protein